MQRFHFAADLWARNKRDALFAEIAARVVDFSRGRVGGGESRLEMIEMEGKGLVSVVAWFTAFNLVFVLHSWWKYGR